MNGQILTRELAAAVDAPVLEGGAVAPYLLDATEARGVGGGCAGGAVPEGEVVVALTALTRALGVDHVGDGTRVNAVCPGTVDSPWVRRLVEDSGDSLEALRARQPLGRLGTTNEVAEAVEFLVAAGFATGTVLVLDGGLTAA